MIRTFKFIRPTLLFLPSGLQFEGRETERQRQRHRDTETQRDRETERQRDRETETEREGEEGAGGQQWNILLHNQFSYYIACMVHNRLHNN